MLPLLQHTGLLLSLALVLDLPSDTPGSGPGIPRMGILKGLAIGVIAVALMPSPWPSPTALPLGTQSVLLSVAGLFFGPLPTLIGMGLAAGLRLIEGGVDTWTAVAAIGVSGSVGILWRHLRPAPARLSLGEIWLMGLAVHTILFGLMLALPTQASHAPTPAIALPLLVVYPAATVLLAGLLAARVRRQRNEGAPSLQASEARGRMLAEQLPAILYRASLDAESPTLYISPRIGDLGYTPEEMTEDPGLWARLVHPDDRDRVLAALDRLTGDSPPGESRVELDYRLRARDGQWRHFHDVAQVVSDPAGPGRYLQGVMLDVTRTREAEESLALFAKRAQALLELPRAAERMDERAFMQFGLEKAEELTGSPIGFIHFVSDNQQEVELVTWSRATLEHYCQATYDAHYPVAQAGIWADAVRESRPVVVNDYLGAPQEEIHRRGLPPGHAELIRLVSIPVLESSLVRMIAGVGNKPEPYTERDLETVQLLANEIWRIVRQRRADAELRKLAQAVEQSPESVVIANLRAEIEYVNDAFVHTTGYSREEAIGKNPRILQSGKTPAATFAAMWEALTQGRVWQGELINRRRDGTDYVERAIVAPLRQPEGQITHYVAVQEDITERKRLAEELEGYRHRLEELVASRTLALSEALATAEATTRAKSAFLANMSHEIRTPMNAIVGLAHLMRSAQTDPTQADRLRQIEESTRHLLGIIDDILIFSKIEAGLLVLEDAEVSLASVLDQVRSLVAEQGAGKLLDLESASDPLPKSLRGDPTRLQRALLNLAANAVKLTEAGRIRLRVRLLEQTSDSALVRFEVQDTGIDIPADQLPQLFESVDRANPSATRRYAGTGLGLAITRRLAELMGGEAGVDSTPGHGSTFWFTARLRIGPIAGPAERPARGLREAGRELRRRHAGARVLLAEDNAINRGVAMGLLREGGLVADTARNGQEAVAMAAAIPYDLILMDVRMPTMDGLEATRAIRKLPNGASTPIVAMTADASPEDRRACLEAGMNDHVPKPVDPQALFAALCRWLGGNGGSGASGSAEPPPVPRGPESAGQPPAAHLDTAALNDAIDRLEGLLTTGDMAASHLMRELETVLGDALGDAAKTVGRQIESFDYDGALRTLRTARSGRPTRS